MTNLPAVREPQQARSRATWSRVLEAGLELLEHGGYSALTIEAICQRAHTTPPAIYARAGNKEGLLLAIYERAMERIEANGIDPADPVWGRLRADELVRRAVDTVSRIWLGHAGLLRPIVHRAADDPEIFRRGSAGSRRLAADFRTLLGSAGVDPAQADVAFRVVYAAVVHRVMYGEAFESDVRLPDRKFTRMLGDVTVRYLQLHEGGTA
jgi:AcrR family transcriptional regulator